MKRLVAIIFLFAVISPARSASGSGLCCQLPGGVQESIFGVLAPEPGRVSLQLTYSFTLMDKIKKGSSGKSVEEVAQARKYLTIPTEMKMTRYALTAVYGFSPGFSVFATVPYIRNTMDMVTVIDMGPLGMNVTKHSMGPVEGPGDVTVMGLYRIYTREDNGSTDALTIGAGVKTPTGPSTEKTGGRFVHAHMQPGTGSWDPLLTLIWSKAPDPFAFQADIAYQIATRNQNGYKFGNSFTANLMGKYALSSAFDITGGLTYLHQDSADDRDKKYTDLTSVLDDPENTGENSVWLSAGLQVMPLKNGMIDLKGQFPVWEYAEGTQLVSSYRILLGISYSF